MSDYESSLEPSLLSPLCSAVKVSCGSSAGKGCTTTSFAFHSSAPGVNSNTSCLNNSLMFGAAYNADIDLNSAFSAPSLAEAEQMKTGVAETFLALFSCYLRTSRRALEDIAHELMMRLREIAQSDNTNRLRESYLIYELLAFGISTGVSQASGSPPAFRPLNCYGRTLNTAVHIDDGKLSEFVCANKPLLCWEINSILIDVVYPPNLLHLLMLSEMFELVAIATGIGAPPRVDLATSLLSKLHLSFISPREATCLKNYLVTILGAHTPCSTFLSSLLESNSSPCASEFANQQRRGEDPAVAETLIYNFVVMLHEAAQQTLKDRRSRNNAPSLRRAGLRRSLSGPIYGAHSYNQRRPDWSKSSAHTAKRRRRNFTNVVSELDDDDDDVSAATGLGFEIIPSDTSNFVSSTLGDDEQHVDDEFFSSEAPFFSREVSTELSAGENQIAFSDIPDDKATIDYDTNAALTDPLAGDESRFCGTVHIGSGSLGEIEVQSPPTFSELREGDQKDTTIGSVCCEQNEVDATLPLDTSRSIPKRGVIIVNGSHWSDPVERIRQIELPVTPKRRIAFTRAKSWQIRLCTSTGVVIVNGLIDEAFMVSVNPLIKRLSPDVCTDISTGDSPASQTSAGCVVLNGVLQATSPTSNGSEPSGCVLINGEIYEVTYEPPYSELSTSSSSSDGTLESSGSEDTSEGSIEEELDAHRHRLLTYLAHNHHHHHRHHRQHLHHSANRIRWDLNYAPTSAQSFIPAPQARRKSTSPLEDDIDCQDSPPPPLEDTVENPNDFIVLVCEGEHGREWASSDAGESSIHNDGLRARGLSGRRRRRGARIKRRRRVAVPRRYRRVSSFVIDNLSDLLRRIADACVRIQPPNNLLHRLLRHSWMWGALALIITGGLRPPLTLKQKTRKKYIRGGTLFGRGPSLQASHSAILFIGSVIKLTDVDSFIAEVLPLVYGLLIHLSLSYIKRRRRGRTHLIWFDGTRVTTNQVAKVIDSCLWIILKTMSGSTPMPLHPLVIKILIKLVINDVSAIIRSRALIILQMTTVRSRSNLRLTEWIIESDLIFLASWLFGQSFLEEGRQVKGNPLPAANGRVPSAYRRKLYPSVEPWEHCRAACLELLATLNTLYKMAIYPRKSVALHVMLENLQQSNAFGPPTTALRSVAPVMAATANKDLVREFTPSPLQILAKKR